MQSSGDCFFSVAIIFTVLASSQANFDKQVDCRLPPDSGNCSKSLQIYYYDARQVRCLEMTYSGCGGNANKFRFRFDCELACSGVMAGSSEQARQVPLVNESTSAPSKPSTAYPVLDESLQGLTIRVDVPGPRISARYFYANITYECGEYLTIIEGVMTLEDCAIYCDTIEEDQYGDECTGLVYNFIPARCDLRKDCGRSTKGRSIALGQESYMKLRHRLDFPPRPPTGTGDSDPASYESPTGSDGQSRGVFLITKPNQRPQQTSPQGRGLDQTTAATPSTTAFLITPFWQNPGYQAMEDRSALRASRSGDVMKWYRKVNGSCQAHILKTEKALDPRSCAILCEQWSSEFPCNGFIFQEQFQRCDLFWKCSSKSSTERPTWVRINL